MSGTSGSHFPYLNGMSNDLRFALRMILAHRWFSAAVVVTLALGIGVNTMVFTLVNAVLLKPVAVPGGSRLVAISHQNLTQGDGSMRFSLPAFRDYRSQASSLERSKPPAVRRAFLANGAILHSLIPMQLAILGHLQHDAYSARARPRISARR